MRRVAVEPSGPLHPYNDSNTYCEVCGKRWLAFLECESKACRTVYSPGNHKPQTKTRGGAGAWYNLYGTEANDGPSVAS